MTPWIAASAVVVGDVTLAEDVSVWPTAVIRGDVERIEVGARSNVQDGAVVHADPGKPTVIGADCVIGHRAIVHGSVLEDGVLVGMGALACFHIRATELLAYTQQFAALGPCTRQHDAYRSGATRPAR